MNRVLRGIGWVVLALTLLVALLIGAFLVWGLPELIPAGTVVRIDGERIDLGFLHQAGVGTWILASLGVLVAAFMVVMIVPLVVIVPLVAAALGMAMTGLALALVLSPLLLLIWWLVRRSSSGRSDTTMAP